MFLQMTEEKSSVSDLIILSFFPGEVYVFRQVNLGISTALFKSFSSNYLAVTNRRIE